MRHHTPEPASTPPLNHDGPPPGLSAAHREALEVGSAISRDVLEARGYFTARGPGEVPDCFPEWQRRAGLVIPTPSPTGELRYQLRPDRPKRDARGRPRKYEQAWGSSMSLDMSMVMADEVRAGTGALWITEGSKKVDALASIGLAALGIIGVHCFAVKGSKGTVPLPDFDAVRLRGRDVVLCYDRDARINPTVQLGLRRLAALVRKLGASRVLVAYLPEVLGLAQPSKAGVDDYLAAGHTRDELEALVEPFKPVDVGAERTRSVPELREALDAAKRLLWERAPGGRGDPGDHKLIRGLLHHAPERGEPTREGLELEVSRRELAEREACAKRTIDKAAARLERAGVLRVLKPKPGSKAGRFLLLCDPRAGVAQYGDARPVGESRLKDQSDEFRESLTRFGLHPRAPSLRASSPGWKPSPKLIAEARKTGRTLPPVREPVRRPGPRAGQALHAYDLCEQAGYVPTDAEVAAALGIKRVRDYRRRTGAKLRELGLLGSEADGSLVAGWLEALRLIRELTDEDRAGRLVHELHQRERAKWRAKQQQRRDARRHPPTHRASPPRKPAPEPERQRAAARLDGAMRELRRLEDTGMDRYEAAASVREGLPEDRAAAWMREGMHPKFTGRVYRTPGREPPGRKLPPQRADGVYVHDPECTCSLCDDSDAGAA